MSAPTLSRRRLLARLGAWLGAAALGLAAALYFKGATDPSWQVRDPQTRARNAIMVAHVHTVERAVEEYAKAHGGRLPPREGWVAALADERYLPGGRLPASPWSLKKRVQAEAIALPAGLVPASAIAAGAEPTPTSSVLGPGRRPEAKPFDGLTYGAILYDLGPGGRTYVIYGVGKDTDYQNQAIVAATATNAAR